MFPRQQVITTSNLFKFVQMPFDLRNTTQTFQWFIDQVLQGLECGYAYSNDLLIASPTPEDNKQQLCSVLKPLRNHNILINPAKCVWGATELQFLGHLVNSQGIRPVVQAIVDFPQPTSLCKLREFLGLINFYHHFIPYILQPLNTLPSPQLPTTPLHWGCYHSFHSHQRSLGYSNPPHAPKPWCSKQQCNGECLRQGCGSCPAAACWLWVVPSLSRCSIWQGTPGHSWSSFLLTMLYLPTHLYRSLHSVARSYTNYRHHNTAHTVSSHCNVCLAFNQCNLPTYSPVEVKGWQDTVCLDHVWNLLTWNRH